MLLAKNADLFFSHLFIEKHGFGLKDDKIIGTFTEMLLSLALLICGIIFIENENDTTGFAFRGKPILLQVTL